ncbi:MAG: hypothetical protein KDA61_10740, partial [Planctomycetales bacterium]|nr:hypothetical protein [Planctomycetales bacterium]
MHDGDAEGDGPVGVGFATADSLYVPLSSAEVVRVDLATGRIAGRASAHDGAELGNLIAHAGAVISVTGSMLERYDQ